LFSFLIPSLLNRNRYGQAMITLQTVRGYDLNITGRPALSIEQLPTPDRLGVRPELIPHIKPRLLVETGDAVRIGTALLEDKRNPRIRLLSPGGGRVADIRFGPRRIIREIIIELEAPESRKEFDPIPAPDVKHMDRESLVQRILDGGLWLLFRELPFRDIPAPEKKPPAVIVSVGAGEPFQPSPQVYLRDRMPLLAFGLDVLRQLSPNVFVYANQQDAESIPALAEQVTHVFKGPYPSHDPGVFLYHTRSGSHENRSWYITGQDLLLLSELLLDGKYPTERIMTVAGCHAASPRHIKARIGAPLQQIAEFDGSDKIRHLVGGILTGTASAPDSFMGFYETALNLVPEGKDREVLAFVRPGFRKPSYSRTFLSRWNREPLEINCNRHGGLRPCIACGYCADVCPVDILPQLAYKSILVEEVEESLSHGLLDCVECGLCSYVCPSKIDLAESLARAKQDYYREQP
jgi:Na+-transporting NADH:ubiquinone oxidoreductase subunit A